MCACRFLGYTLDSLLIPEMGRLNPYAFHKDIDSCTKAMIAEVLHGTS